jgi:hypothetical protein
MRVDTAVFDQVKLANYSLQGAEYRLFNPTSENYRESLALISDSTYNHSSFTNLEAYYRRVGLENAADDVYFHGKLRERKVVSWSGYFWNLFLLITVGYGKYPGIALLWSILFISIGRRCFRKQNMTLQSPSGSDTNVGAKENEDKVNPSSTKTDDLKGYSPWWYSIALFLPIVDLEDAKKYTPAPERKGCRHYMRVHVILGFLLVPIGLAAWTGLLK